MKSQMHAQPVVCYGATVTTIFSLSPDPKRIEPFLREVVSVNVSVDNSCQVCSSCYKFFKIMLASDVCMLSSEDIVSELQAKKKHLERIVDEFEYITLEPSILSNGASTRWNCTHVSW